MTTSMFPKIMGQVLGEPRKMIDRKEVLKKAGEIVLVRYQGVNKQECFVIGWLFNMDENSIRLKITSTRFESYESAEVDILKVISVDSHQMN